MSESSQARTSALPVRPAASFFGAPVGDLEDLRPGTIAAMGVYCDHYSGGQPGGRFAARQLRYTSTVAVPWDRQPMRDPVPSGQVVFDLGDFNVFPLEPERTFAIVSEQTQRIAATGARLLAIGGDYSVSPAIVRGLTQQLGADDLALIRVSRRVDLQRVPPQGTSGPTRHCATTDIASHLRGGLACVALLGARGTISAEEQQRAGAANATGATELATAPGQAAAAAVGALARVASRFYLSVDIDVLAPRFGAAALPATRGGLTLTQLHEVLTSFSGLTFVGAELTGHVPDLDVPGRAVSTEIAGLGAAMLQLLMANKAHSAKPGP